MKLVNEITMEIVKNVKDGESIHCLASRIGFAYSAVYKWVYLLERYNVVNLIGKGNKTMIKVNKNLIYNKFLELNKAISVVEKDEIFWGLVKKMNLRIRFVKGSAVSIWSKGGFVTGDFYDRIYFLEVYMEDLGKLKDILEKNEIEYSENEIKKIRPLVFLSVKEKFKMEKLSKLPVMPLNELVKWCEELGLDNVLEQLNDLYGLGLNTKYEEARTNV